MLIAMCCWNTPENGRFVPTVKTIDSLRERVNLARHRIVIVDNFSTCAPTQQLLHGFAAHASGRVKLVKMDENIGTARAINRAWAMREPGEHVCKIDNDVVVHQSDWPDIMEEVFARDQTIGQAGLKRNDLSQSPWCDNPHYQTKLEMLQHNPGQRWIVVEHSEEIMGTCVGHSSALLNRVGYLSQPGPYGWEDILMSWRSLFAGFKNVFIPSVPIDHVDNIQPDYQKWKGEQASIAVARHCEITKGMEAGTISLYCDMDGIPAQVSNAKC